MGSDLEWYLYASRALLEYLVPKSCCSLHSLGDIESSFTLLSCSNFHVLGASYFTSGKPGLSEISKPYLTAAGSAASQGKGAVTHGALLLKNNFREGGKLGLLYLHLFAAILKEAPENARRRSRRAVRYFKERVKENANARKQRKRGPLTWKSFIEYLDQESFHAWVMLKKIGVQVRHSPFKPKIEDFHPREGVLGQDATTLKRIISFGLLCEVSLKHGLILLFLQRSCSSSSCEESLDITKYF